MRIGLRLVQVVNIKMEKSGLGVYDVAWGSLLVVGADKNKNISICMTENT